MSVPNQLIVTSEQSESEGILPGFLYGKRGPERRAHMHRVQPLRDLLPGGRDRGLPWLKYLMRGNHTIGEAAVRAGCRYYFGYPDHPPE